MKNSNYQEEYKVFQENNQLVLILNSEILLPENDPVRVTSAQLPPLSDHRQEECPGGAVLPGTGFQSQEAVDEAGKKQRENPLFREKSYLTGSKQK